MTREQKYYSADAWQGIFKKEPASIETGNPIKCLSGHRRPVKQGRTNSEGDK